MLSGYVESDIETDVKQEIKMDEEKGEFNLCFMQAYNLLLI